jgi:hypothetical protein
MKRRGASIMGHNHEKLNSIAKLVVVYGNLTPATARARRTPCQAGPVLYNIGSVAGREKRIGLQSLQCRLLVETNSYKRINK